MQCRIIFLGLQCEKSWRNREKYGFHTKYEFFSPIAEYPLRMDHPLCGKMTPPNWTKQLSTLPAFGFPASSRFLHFKSFGFLAKKFNCNSSCLGANCAKAYFIWYTLHRENICFRRLLYRHMFSDCSPEDWANQNTDNCIGFSQWTKAIGTRNRA